MMRTFNQVQLKEIAEVFSGYAFKSEDFREKGIPAIKISNIRNGDIDLEDNNTQYLDEYFLKHVDKKFVVKKGDILISLTGSHLTQPNSVVGRIASYKYRTVSLLNQRAGKIVIKKKEKCNQEYLYYYLSTNVIRKEIALLASGAANQANVSPKDIEKVKVLLPPLPVQEKIAAILSAYDDLIENNNRRIALLEKMAEEIYREWFVRMRFPGHEQVTFHKGLPEGWEVINLPKICNKVTDGTHDTPKPSNDGFYLVTGKHIKDNFIDFSEAYYISSEDHFNISKRSKLDKGDIILSNIGSIAIVDQDFEFSAKNVIIIKPLNYKYTIFLYFLFNSTSTQEQFKQESSGTSQKFLCLSYVRNFKLLLPSKNLIENFAEITSPVLREREKLYKVNQKLKISRDLLLPRLIGGKLSVEKLDIKFPPHMEEPDA